MVRGERRVRFAEQGKQLRVQVELPGGLFSSLGLQIPSTLDRLRAQLCLWNQGLKCPLLWKEIPCTVLGL
jgi:hypothetical protein